MIVSVESRSRVENMLVSIMLVARTCVCCDRIIGIENTELIVTYVLENY